MNQLHIGDHVIWRYSPHRRGCGVTPVAGVVVLLHNTQATIKVRLKTGEYVNRRVAYKRLEKREWAVVV